MVAFTMFLPGTAQSASGSDSKKPRSEARRPMTVARRLAEVGDRARARMKPLFRRQSIAYPPPKLTLVALKRERLLKLYAPGPDGEWRLVAQYPIAAASGRPGPKLREGDMQVPEGIYRITHLNPESLFHLSLALNYPNEFDRLQGRRDKRRNLGKDIMLHGSWYSEGCLALGDTAAEDLFVLAADTGLPKVRVVIAPVDFRHTELDEESVTPATHPAWTAELYATLKRELAAYDDGASTRSLLIRYADASPPRPPDLGDTLLALYELIREALLAPAPSASPPSATGAE